MSRKMSLNPKSGYVALPLDILEINMSPGAFRLLAELCKMANVDGYCWPSLGQLSERLGRSKAALSGYVKELRELSLLETQTQRTANGYNYRLKYLVVFWKKWRASFRQVGSSDKSVQRSERSVKQAECDSDKNQKNKNQAHSRLLNQLKNEWADLARGEQYPAFASSPSHSLLQASQRELDTVSKRAKSPKDIEDHFVSFFNSRNLHIAEEQLEQSRAMLTGLSQLADPLLVLNNALHREWEDHWRYPPSATWIKALLAKIKKDNPEIDDLLMIKFYLRQYQQWRQT